MAASIDWFDGRHFVKAALESAHRARHNLGREVNAARRMEIDRMREAGNEARAAQLEESARSKSIGFMRGKRRREELERESHLRRVGASVRREERKAFKRQPPDRLFQQFEAPLGGERAGLRDLYYDWNGRGFSSGIERDYSKHVKRSTSRTTPWKSGEMGRKIRYIFRDDALELVEGNVITNMGDDILEAVACAKVIERLEGLARESNGGVYHHVILSLPYELSGAQRAELLQELTQPLRQMGLPYCAALHKPDRRGDQRNYHAHVVVSLRPMRRIEGYAWEFETSKLTSFNTTAGLLLQRKFVARKFNQALAAAGHSVRWTAKSRKSRGEATPGNNKMGPELSRALRDQASATEALRDARHKLFDAGTISRDLTKLEAVASDLEASFVIATELLAGAVPVVQQVVAECTSDVHELRERVAGSVVTVPELDGIERVLGEGIVDAVEAVELAPSAVVEQPVQKTVPLPHGETTNRKKPQKRVPSPRFIPELEEADVQAVQAMRNSGETMPRSDVVQSVRRAIVAGGLFGMEIGAGKYEVTAADHSVLKAWVTFIRTDAGKAYCRSIIDHLPPPPAGSDKWAKLSLVRQEQGLDLDTQKAFLEQAARGR